MSYLRLPFLFLVLGCVICSCSHKIVCKRYNENIYGMKIPDYDTGVKTTVRVIKYEAGSNFTKILDSTDYPVKESFDMPVDENKDYKLILLPKNRQHTITNVHFGNEKRKGSTGLDSEQCYASVAFTFDGSSKTQVYWIEYGRPTLVDISL